MRLLAGIALAVAAAAPAQARDTVAPGSVTAGPVIAGDGAAWAGRTPSGAVRVLTMRDGGSPVVARRWGRPARGSDREITAVAAGGRRGAAIVTTCTHTVGLELGHCAPRAFSGSFARLRGPRLPERVGARCRGNAREVAVGGAWTAVIVERLCPFADTGSLAAGRRIEASRGARRLAIPLRDGYGLRLAGRYLAWQDGDGGAVLFDLRRGERVRRLGTSNGRIGGLDVQADGTLALTRFRPQGTVCVTVLDSAGTERDLACRYESIGGDSQTGGEGGAGPEPTVAISGGRVLYLRYRSELVLQEPGAEPVVVARFRPPLARTGGFDLGPSGATWAQQRYRFPAGSDGMPGSSRSVGRPRVVLRRL